MEVKGYKDKHEYTNKNGVTSVVYLMDCMDLLKQVPDKYFELAVVDPPYGIGIGKTTNTNGKNRKKREVDKYEKKGWDSVRPEEEYWNALNTTSREQIVFGANYFIDHLKITKGWIFWDKKNACPSFSDGELIYTSFNKVAKIISISSVIDCNGGIDRFHPTQKPIKLYEWLIKNYAKPNDKILDTHLGSGSSRIAADKANLPFIGCELDSDYFYASVKRFKEYAAQQTMF